MHKPFDDWNIQKKHIQNNNKIRHYHERDIWWCVLGVNVGYEEDGKGSTHERPVLILKGFNKRVCLVVPLTTSTKINPYYLYLGNYGGRDSYALITQIRLIDTKRLTNRIAFLEKETFEKTKKAIRDLLR